jgi:formate hydrogenlyase transcriptional activator
LLELQSKPLRALQEREIDRPGGSRPITVNVRPIAATNRELGKMVAESSFAPILTAVSMYSRTLPLRCANRATDIPLLVRHFVDTHTRMNKNIRTIPEETMQALIRWAWPGNIRELENLMERSVILTRGPVLYVPLAELNNADAPNDENGKSAVPDPRMGERDRMVRTPREAKGRIAGPS